MPRPVKCRRVNFLPEVKYYKPAGVPIRNVEEVCLSIEEVESIRLKDLEGLEQEESAEMMNISRPTFHRVLNSARHKIAEALFSGKAIRISGGNFEIPPCHFKCINGHEWIFPLRWIKTNYRKFARPARCRILNALILLKPKIVLSPVAGVASRAGWPRCPIN
jgi:uncharacterized protein